MAKEQNPREKKAELDLLVNHLYAMGVHLNDLMDDMMMSPTCAADFLPVKNLYQVLIEAIPHHVEEINKGLVKINRERKALERLGEQYDESNIFEED